MTVAHIGPATVYLGDAYAIRPTLGPARFDHPTCKPDALMASIIANIAGDTVCDPFMGTGSTGVAAIRAGKRFTGIEHNPIHYHTAVRRISDAWAEMQSGAA